MARLFMDVAQGLLAEWGSKVTLDETSVADVLEKLVNSGIITSLAAATTTAGKIALAKKGIEFFQSQWAKTNDKGEDGMLGELTMAAVKKLCDATPESRKPTKELDASKKAEVASATRNGKKVVMYFYFIHDDLKNLRCKDDPRSGVALINQALEFWQNELPFLWFRIVETPKEATLIIEYMPSGDGKGGVVALGDVGGPSNIGRQLTLRFDPGENWKNEPAESFICTAAHELGHILGLSHLNPPNRLMSAFKNPKVFRPQLEDVAAAKAIWKDFLT